VNPLFPWLPREEGFPPGGVSVARHPCLTGCNLNGRSAAAVMNPHSIYNNKYKHLMGNSTKLTNNTWGVLE
jgi:hypothetical protein